MEFLLKKDERRDASRRTPHRARHGNTLGAARPALVDAQTLAGLLGVAREFVYDHPAELGALRLGDGPAARRNGDALADASWAQIRQACKPVMRATEAPLLLISSTQRAYRLATLGPP
jgi:hypothetical protein